MNVELRGKSNESFLVVGVVVKTKKKYGRHRRHPVLPIFLLSAISFLVVCVCEREKEYLMVWPEEMEREKKEKKKAIGRESSSSKRLDEEEVSFILMDEASRANSRERTATVDGSRERRIKRIERRRRKEKKASVDDDRDDQVVDSRSRYRKTGGVRQQSPHPYRRSNLLLSFNGLSRSNRAGEEREKRRTTMEEPARKEFLLYRIHNSWVTISSTSSTTTRKKQ